MHPRSNMIKLDHGRIRRPELHEIKWRNGKCRSLASSNAASLATKNMRRSASRTIPPSMTSRRLSLRPCDLACARCATRSERSADKSGEKGAEKARLAEQAFQEPPSMHYDASKSSPRR